VELVINELQKGIQDGVSYRQLEPKILAKLLSKTWPELCCPAKAHKNAEQMAAVRGPEKVNPLIRRMFEKKKPRKLRVNPLIRQVFSRGTDH
jgi:UDP:flavonoid glycosyltransferase YjiC (YdhE family)